MHWSVDSPYEHICEVQRELRERAARAQLVAEARREAAARLATAGPLSRAAQILRAVMARP